MNGKVYNLDEQAGQDFFGFILDNHTYKMFYPSSKEVMTLTEVMNESETFNSKIAGLQETLASLSGEELKAAEKQLFEYQDKAKIAQTSFLEWCAGYVKPELETSPDFKDTLMNKNLKFMLAFMNMVKSEFNE